MEIEEFDAQTTKLNEILYQFISMLVALNILKNTLKILSLDSYSE